MVVIIRKARAQEQRHLNRVCLTNFAACRGRATITAKKYSIATTLCLLHSTRMIIIIKNANFRDVANYISLLHGTLCFLVELLLSPEFAFRNGILPVTGVWICLSTNTLLHNNSSRAVCVAELMATVQAATVKWKCMAHW